MSDVQMYARMQSVTAHIREHLLHGVFLEPLRSVTLADIKAKNLCFESFFRCMRLDPGFERLMRNRVEMGALRYGARGPVPGVVEGALGLVAKYRETKNLEFLVNAANYLMIEWTFPSHPGHYTSAGPGAPIAGAFGDIANQTLEHYLSCGLNIWLLDAVVELQDEFLTPTLPGAFFQPLDRP